MPAFPVEMMRALFQSAFPLGLSSWGQTACQRARLQAPGKTGRGVDRIWMYGLGRPYVWVHGPWQCGTEPGVGKRRRWAGWAAPFVPPGTAMFCCAPLSSPIFNSLFTWFRPCKWLEVQFVGLHRYSRRGRGNVRVKPVLFFLPGRILSYPFPQGPPPGLLASQRPGVPLFNTLPLATCGYGALKMWLVCLKNWILFNPFKF